MSNFAPTWTDDRIAALRRLAADPARLSASQIAALLGGVSRNAVIGKLHRMGDGARRVIKAKPKPEPRPVNPVLLRPKPRPSTPRPDLGIEVDRITDLPADQSEFACTIIELGADMCRFPLGVPSALMTYCGAPCSGSWCERHRRVVYTRRSME